MPLPALALVVIAALLHAMWNFLAKQAGGDARFGLLSSLLLMLFWAPLGIYMGWDVVPTWGRTEWLFIMLSAITHVGYFVCLLKGYRAADLTVVYPLARGSGPVLSSLAAFMFMGEAVTLGGGIGLSAVVIGVFLIAGGLKLVHRAKVATTLHDQAEAQRLRLGVMYGLLTGLWIASYTAIDGYAVKFLAMSPILLDYVSNFFRIPLYAPSVWKDRATLLPIWKTYWKPALAVATFGSLGYALVLYAVTMAPLSRVAPAREISMLFAALIGGHLLQEGDRSARVAGAVMIALGVVALAW
jgi:drug/metabolite transporter (DMT)-like permease